MGSQTDGWVCVPCTSPLRPYDVMYLVSWVLFVLWSNCLAIMSRGLRERQRCARPRHFMALYIFLTFVLLQHVAVPLCRV